MKNKPNLILSNEDVKTGLEYPNEVFILLYKADLIAILKYMTSNKISITSDTIQAELKKIRTEIAIKLAKIK